MSAFMLFSSMVLGSGSVANAQSKEESDEKEVEELANELEYVFKDSTYIKDGEFYLKEENLKDAGLTDEDINGVKQIIAYWNDEEIADLNNNENEDILSDEDSIQTASWTICMKDKILDEFDFIEDAAIFSTAIKHKQWKRLAKLIIKKGAKRSPYVLAGWLALQAGKCYGH